MSHVSALMLAPDGAGAMPAAPFARIIGGASLGLADVEVIG